jgi:hypothetical protein
MVGFRMAMAGFRMAMAGFRMAMAGFRMTTMRVGFRMMIRKREPLAINA